MGMGMGMGCVIQLVIDEVQSKLTSTETELSRISDEYTRYKARAHGVLKQQTQELSKVSKESVEMAQLQSSFDDLKSRYAALETEAKLDPQLVSSYQTSSLLSLQLLFYLCSLRYPTIYYTISSPSLISSHVTSSSPYPPHHY
jgi:hypothetical protein